MADEYYDSVSLLLPFNDTAGATRYADFSKYNRPAQTLLYHSTETAGTVSGTGVAHHYATSLECVSSYDGVGVVGDGDYFDLITPGTTSDFTIDFWVFMDPSDGAGMFQGNPAAFYLFYANSGAAYAFVADAVLSLHGPAADLSVDLSALVGFDQAVWHHVEIGRGSGTLYGFLDGVLIDTPAADAGAITGGTDRALDIGHNSDSGYFYGYFNDFRVTDGVCRHTANFTPPGALLASISGTVTGADGDPAQRTVIAVPRAYPVSNAWSTQSDAVDGSYSLEVPDAEMSRIVLADEATLINDIVDRVIPG